MRFKFKKLLMTCIAIAFVLPWMFVLSACNGIPVGGNGNGEPDPIMVTFTLHDGIIDGGIMNGTTSTKSVEKGSTVTIRPLTFISFNYFADVSRSAIFAWRHQVDPIKGATVYVNYDIEIRAINMQNTVGIGATGTPADEWLSEEIEKDPLFNLANSSTGIVSPMNTVSNINNIHILLDYIRMNDPLQTTFSASDTRISAHSVRNPQRTFNSAHYDMNLTLHYPADFTLFIFYIIYVPELGFHVAMPSTTNAPLTTPNTHAQFTNATGQTFRLTFGQA